MGGEIDFVSVEDVGARFFFTVSFQRADRLGSGSPRPVARRRRVGAFDPSTSDVGVRPSSDGRRRRRPGSVDAVLDAGAPGGSVGLGRLRAERLGRERPG